MIHINLLPEHFRRSDRMPLGKFALVLASLLLASGSVVYYFYLQFNELSPKVAIRKDLEEQLASLKPQLDQHKALLDEKGDYEKREAKIKEISSSRILWAKKFDQLCDIVNAGEDTARYTVWFENLKVGQTADGKSGTGGKLEAKGLSGSANSANVANFYEDIQKTQFYKDFVKINNPGGTLQDPDKELIPAQVWEFKLDMGLRPPPDDGKKKPAAPAKTSFQGKGAPPPGGHKK